MEKETLARSKDVKCSTMVFVTVLIGHRSTASQVLGTIYGMAVHPHKAAGCGWISRSHDECGQCTCNIKERT
jgi:hypothetical protein